MFWDCSWVQNNIVNGKDYGTHAFELLREIAVTPTTNQPLAAMLLQKQRRPYPTRKHPPRQYFKRPRALLQHESLQLVSKDFLALSFQHLLLEMISICYPLI